MSVLSKRFLDHQAFSSNRWISNSNISNAVQSLCLNASIVRGGRGGCGRGQQISYLLWRPCSTPHTSSVFVVIGPKTLGLFITDPILSWSVYYIRISWCFYGCIFRFGPQKFMLRRSFLDFVNLFSTFYLDDVSCGQVNDLVEYNLGKL